MDACDKVVIRSWQSQPCDFECLSQVGVRPVWSVSKDSSKKARLGNYTSQDTWKPPVIHLIPLRGPSSQGSCLQAHLIFAILTKLAIPAFWWGKRGMEKKSIKQPCRKIREGQRWKLDRKSSSMGNIYYVCLLRKWFQQLLCKPEHWSRVKGTVGVQQWSPRHFQHRQEVQEEMTEQWECTPTSLLMCYHGSKS